jgi:hypothetical protein
LSPPYGDPIVPLSIPTDEEQRISQPSILMDDYTRFGKEGQGMTCPPNPGPNHKLGIDQEKRYTLRKAGKEYRASLGI